MIARMRLYLTSGRDRLVAECDADAAFLYAAPGHVIPDADAERFGLIDGLLPDAPVAAAKEKQGAEDKQAEAAGDKGGLKILRRAKRS